MDWCELAEFIAVLRAHANLDLLQAELPLLTPGIEVRPLTKNPCSLHAVVARRGNGSSQLFVSDFSIYTGTHKKHRQLNT